MLVEKLKVNDLVYYTNPETKEKVVATVISTSLEDQTVGIEISNSDESIITDSIYISGIPLTKEIIEKNFDECIYNEYKHEKSGLCFNLIYKNKSIEYIEVYKWYDTDIEGEVGPYLTSVTDVHELQHLLWALGWKDNIKL